MIPHTVNMKDKVMVWFFAGGETTSDIKFNIFTGSFIRLMKLIMERDFDYIRGIYYRLRMMNVIWALNHAQRPISNHSKTTLPEVAGRQILLSGLNTDTQLIMVSSSTGSVVAAQTACYLAERNRINSLAAKPFHLALGSTLISKESKLFRMLEFYKEEGLIGKIIYDDLQDEGDNIVGIGGITKREAWLNAFGLILPVFSRKFQGPSFLNTNPQKGHFHRRRSQTRRKALDFIDILLIKHNLAGDYYRERAKVVIEKESV